MATTALTARQFQDSDGTGDWRVLNAGADAWFETDSHTAGAAFLRRIGDLAEAAGHHPDVDLRADGVHVRLFTHDAGSLTDKDVELARQISTAATDLGLAADPAAVQRLQLAIDARDVAAVVPFWQTALGFDRVDEDLLVDPLGRHPRIWFQEMDAPRPLRNRIHVDAGTPWERRTSTTRSAAADASTSAWPGRSWTTRTSASRAAWLCGSPAR